MKKLTCILLVAVAAIVFEIPLYAQWVHVGLGSTLVRTLAVSANGSSGRTIFAGTSNGGLFISTNNGEDWIPSNNGLTNNYVSEILVSGSRVIAGTMGSGIFISTNNGTSWAHSTGASNAFVYCMVGDSIGLGDGSLFAGANMDVYRSTDNGFSWFPLNTLFSGYRTALAAAPRTGGGINLFAGDGYFDIGDGHIYLSTDSGMNWALANQGILTEMVNVIAVSPTGSGESNIFAGTEGTGIFLSTNDGSNWNGVNSGLTSLYVYDIVVAGTTLVAGTSGGVFLSTDNGTSWSAVNEGLSNQFIFSLMVSDTYLFAGTYDGGVWRRSLSELVTSVEISSTAIPEQFTLEQNYPNPFNPSTVISYQLPVNGNVTLKVYDVLGNEIITLINEEKPAGSYEVEFTASQLPSGTYFYQLKAGSFIESKKMILMK